MIAGLTHDDLHVESDGAVLVDPNRFGPAWAGPVGRILPVVGTGRLVWIPDDNPTEAWPANSVDEAKKGLAAYLLRHYGQGVAA